jgi:hypothetical protein
VVAIVLGAIFGPVLALRAANMAQHAQAIASMGQSVSAIAKNSAPFTGAATSPTMWQPPSDIVESGVYTGEGKRVYMLEGINILMTEEGDIVTIDDRTNSNTKDGSSTLHYNEETQEVIDGRNRRLAIFLNSQRGVHEVRDGGRTTRAIKLDETIYMVNYRISEGNYTMIYVSRRVHHSGVFIFRTTTIKFYDMNGHELDNDRIGFPQPPAAWKALFPPLFIREVANWTVAVVLFEIYEETTLRKLLHDISKATEHPWPRIYCPDVNDWVMTEDGQPVMVNMATKQLTDWFGFALFNAVTGLPIVFHNDDIVTTNMKPQVVENGVLKDAMSVWQMLQTGQVFYMHIVPTLFGYFNVPVFNRGTADKPDWRLMNGDSTEGITMPHVDYRASGPSGDINIFINPGDIFKILEPIIGDTSGGVNFLQGLGTVIIGLLGIALLVIVGFVIIKLSIVIGPFLLKFLVIKR